MIVVDANILLYAYDLHATQHLRCRDWFNQAMNGNEQIGLPWQSLLAFIRIATNTRAYRQPLSGSRACELVDSWLARPQALLIEPGQQFWEIFRAQIREARAHGPLVTDTALAALAIERGATLCTTDRDFRRFDGLRLLDPTTD